MMKCIVSAATIMIIFFVIGCSKNDNGIVSVTGKWNIVTDTGYTGVGAGNHAVTYIGEAADYFIFSSDGNLYTKEGSFTQTSSYKIISDTTVQIKSFSNTVKMINLTAHSVIILAPFAYTPGGTFGRKVILSR